MAEQGDTAVEVFNPTSEDFTWTLNGEPFTIKAGEKRYFGKDVGIHLAKHLSTKMITEEVKKKRTKKQIEDVRDAVHLKVAQLSTYDTHERRIALYRILGDKMLVQDVLTRYPFKGFIGEMKEYEEFVSKEETKISKQEEKEKKTETAEKVNESNQ